MLHTYPTDQIIPSQHPNHPNYWMTDSINQADKALRQALRTLANGHDAFFVFTSEEIYIDLKRDDNLLSTFEWLLAADCTIFASTFGSNEWHEWDHQLLGRCITNIKVVRNQP